MSTESIALCRMANDLHQQGRHSEALAAYDRAIELNPRYPAALNNRGVALLALSQPGYRRAPSNYVPPPVLAAVLLPGGPGHRRQDRRRFWCTAHVDFPLGRVHDRVHQASPVMASLA